LPEPLACLGPPVRAAERGAEVDEGTRVPEAGLRAWEHLGRLLEQPGSRPAFTQTERAQGGADSLRVTPPPGERELFGGEPTRLVVPIQQSKALGGPAAPRHVAWIVKQDQPKGLAHPAQLLDAPLGASGLDAHTGAVEPKPDQEDLVEW